MRVSRLVVRWLEVRRFRNLAQRAATRLEFGDDLVLVVGVNGAGKTTLLELLAAVLRSDFRPFEAESFDLSFRLERAPFPEHGRLNADESWPSVEVTVRNEVNGRSDPRVSHGTHWAWRASYRSESVVASLGSPAVPPQVVDLAATDATHLADGLPGLFDGSLLAALRDRFPATAAAPRTLGFDLLPDPQWSATRRLDEALAFFEGLLGDIESSATPTVTDGGSWVGWPSTNPLEPATAHTDPTGLYRIDWLEPAVPVHVTARLEGARDGRRYYRGVTLRAAWNGEAIASDTRLWSFGQKRLLALAWYVDCLTSANRQLDPCGVLLLDEVYNGLHHAWLEAVMREIRRRRPQVFATAQSPLLLDFLEFDSPSDVARSIVRCTTGHDGWVWASPTPAQAGEVFGAYQRGVLQVSEILRRDGVW